MDFDSNYDCFIPEILTYVTFWNISVEGIRKNVFDPLLNLVTLDGDEVRTFDTWKLRSES